MNDTAALDRDSFGGPPELADALLDLVLSGRKTATCWDARHGCARSPGGRRIFCDGSGRSRAVVETLSVELRRYCDVDEAFARAEGEGDLSLAYWRVEHRRFFESQGAFSEEMTLWCERFRLIEALP